VPCENLDVQAHADVMPLFYKVLKSSPLSHYSTIPRCTPRSGVNIVRNCFQVAGWKKETWQSKRMPQLHKRKVPRSTTHRLPFISHWLTFSYMAIPSCEGVNCKAGKCPLLYQFWNTHFRLKLSSSWEDVHLLLLVTRVDTNLRPL
jgi:hypothetical protein